MRNDEEEDTRKSEDERASGDEHASVVVAGPPDTFINYDPTQKSPKCILMSLNDTKTGPGKKKKETPSKRYFLLAYCLLLSFLNS